MRSKKHHILLSLLFIGIISVPGIQTFTRLLPERPLSGTITKQEIPALRFDSLYQGTIQDGLNRYAEQNYGFRGFFTRLYNQLDYSLFRQSHGSNIIIGKERYLFEEWVISSHYGKNFIGIEKIHLKIRWLNLVAKYFRSQGKELIVIIAPGKADFYPEYIPDRLRDTVGMTNYKSFLVTLAETEIPVLDFNELFVRMKDSSACMLFPKTGTHWSHYGARIATDTLAAFLEKIIGRSIPSVGIAPGWPSDSILFPDHDLELIMNLFFPLPRNRLCYPEVIWQDSSGFSLPSGIVIGDSFFWEMYNLNLTGKLFSQLQYWYYNSTIYSNSLTDKPLTSQLDFPEAFENADLILLMANPSNIHDLGWGFIERVYKELIFPDWQKEYDKMVREYIQAIQNTPEWEKQIEKQAIENGIPKDSQMIRDARYMVEQYLLLEDLL